MLPDNLCGLLVGNDAADPVQMKQWDGNKSPCNEKDSGDEQIKKCCAYARIKVARRLKQSDKQIKAKPKCKCIDAPADELVLVILSDKSIKLFNQNLVIVHLLKLMPGSDLV